MSFYSRLRQPVAFLPRWAFILIVCLVVLLPVCSLWGWVAWRDYSTVSMESGKHLLAAFEMGRTMRQGQSLQGLFYGTGEYPPLVYCTTAFILHFFPVNTESLALLSLVPYLLIISAAAYMLSRFYVGRWEALAVTSTASTLCLLSIMSFGYMLEPALMAAVTLALVCLLASRGLSRWRCCLLLGIISGLGMLIKWTFIIYVGPAFLLALFLRLVYRKKKVSLEQLSKSGDILGQCDPDGPLSTVLLNASLTVLVAILLAAPWYIHSWQSIVNYYQTVVGSFLQPLMGLDRPGNPGTLSLLLNMTLPLYLAAMLCLGVVYMVVKGTFFRRPGIFLMLTVLVPLMAFLVIQAHDPRFMEPVLVPVLVIAWSFAEEFAAIHKSLAATASLVACTTAFAWASGFGTSLYGPEAFPITYSRFEDPLGIVTTQKIQGIDALDERLQVCLQQGQLFEFVSERADDFLEETILEPLQEADLPIVCYLLYRHGRDEVTTSSANENKLRLKVKSCNFTSGETANFVDNWELYPDDLQNSLLSQSAQARKKSVEAKKIVIYNISDLQWAVREDIEMLYHERQINQL